MFISVVIAMISNLGHSFFMSPRVMRLNALSLVKHSSCCYTRNAIPIIEVSSTSTISFAGDLLVIPFYKPVPDNRSVDSVLASTLMQHLPAEVDKNLKHVINDVLNDGVFKADVSSRQLIRLPDATGTSRYIALVGLGPDPKKGKSGDMDVKSASRLGKSIAALAKEMKAKSVGVIMPPSVGNAGVSPMLVAIHDALYVDERFKKVPEEGFPPLHWKTLTLLSCSNTVTENIALTSRLANMISSGVQLTKDLVGRSFPSSFMDTLSP